jgi:hypothetical protein
MKPSTGIAEGPNHVTVDSFKILLEMFTEALSQIDKSVAWRPGDAQLINAKAIIFEFYSYQHGDLSRVAVEMFNDRVVGNLRNDEMGKLTHSQYQPEPLVRYTNEVINWALVAGLVSVPAMVTLH